MVDARLLGLSVVPASSGALRKPLWRTRGAVGSLARRHLRFCHCGLSTTGLSVAQFVMGRFQEYSVIGRRLPSEREPQVRSTAHRPSLTAAAEALPHAHLRAERRRGQVALLVLHQGALIARRPRSLCQKAKKVKKGALACGLGSA